MEMAEEFHYPLALLAPFSEPSVLNNLLHGRTAPPPDPSFSFNFGHKIKSPTRKVDDFICGDGRSWIGVQNSPNELSTSLDSLSRVNNCSAFLNRARCEAKVLGEPRYNTGRSSTRSRGPMSRLSES